MRRSTGSQAMPEGRANWLDQWRLLFAGLVIFSHSFALVNQHDPLEIIGGPTDIGKLAVAGFLLISGYLIAKAWDRSTSFIPYLRNRFLRIAPGFAVAFWLSTFAALAVGGSADWAKLPGAMFGLGQPPAQFPTPDHRLANGPLWTIQLEFACYLLAPLLTRSRLVLVASWAVVALLTLLTPEKGELILASWWLRGGLMFLSGAGYYRFGLASRRRTMLLCAAILSVSMLTPFWEIGLALAGGYLLLSLGLRERPAFGWRDISFGVYLYGWPVQKLLVIGGVVSPWLLFGAAVSLASVAGGLSCLLIERPALTLKRRGPAPQLAPAE